MLADRGQVVHKGLLGERSIPGRGRKLRHGRVPPIPVLQLGERSIPGRGRKPVYPVAPPIVGPPTRRTLNPRKGTETSWRHMHSHEPVGLGERSIPGRGRKPCRARAARTAALALGERSIPGRGRKPSAPLLTCTRAQASENAQSPEGDGNQSATNSILGQELTRRTLNPRKGTETIPDLTNAHDFPPSRRTLNPRKGTETGVRL